LELPALPIDEAPQSESDLRNDLTIAPLAGNAGEDVGIDSFEHARMDERRQLLGSEQRQNVLDYKIAEAAFPHNIQVAEPFAMAPCRRRPCAEQIQRDRPVPGEVTDAAAAFCRDHRLCDLGNFLRSQAQGVGVENVDGLPRVHSRQRKITDLAHRDDHPLTGVGGTRPFEC